MKKFGIIFALATAFALVFCLVGCGGGQSNSQPGETVASQPPDLAGTWKQTNSKSEDSYQEAVLKDGIITINWVSDGGDTKSLYWVGTYEVPKGATTKFEWTSTGDTEKMSKSLLASTDSTKDMKYDNGTISYSASALGTTTTIKLEKEGE